MKDLQRSFGQTENYELFSETFKPITKPKTHKAKNKNTKHSTK